MSEYKDPFTIAREIVDATHGAFETARQAEPNSAEHTKAVADLALLGAMSVPVMKLHESPFARPGTTAEEAELQFNPTEGRRQMLLNSSRQGFLDRYGPQFAGGKMLTHVDNALGYNGIRCLRDILVLGSDEVKDFRNLGDKSFKALKQMIASTTLDVSWQRKPTIEDIAQICDRTDQIFARKFHKAFGNNEEIQTLTDLLRQDLPSLKARLTQYYQHDSVKPDIPRLAVDIMSDAHDFAANFEDIRKGRG